jgi:catechol 2,3-dioxygenase-like lactoylglutathione lyase family enzyme
MSVLFAGLPVADLQPALEWYERLLGRPPDMRPNEREATWQLADAGWVYVVADPDRAGKGLITLIVDDLEAHVAELTGRGIEAGAIETLGSVVMKSEVVDPEGNRITFGQPLRG